MSYPKEEIADMSYGIDSATDSCCHGTAYLMIEGFQAEYLLADRSYNTDAIFPKTVDKELMPIIPPRKSESICGNMTHIPINSVILSRIRFCFLKDGAVSLYAMPKIPLLSLLPSKFVVLPFDPLFIDDTV